MEAIDISLKYDYDKDRYDASREPYIVEIIKRLENDQDVFVQFDESDKKRPGAIAKVRKIEGKSPSENPWPRGLIGQGISNYTLYLKWDDRKNTAKVNLNSSPYRNFRLNYLRGYEGETVWSFFDPKKYAQDNAEPIYDRLNREINIGNTVVFINAAYGSGNELDFGVVKEIKRIAKKNWSDKLVIESTVVIETIATSENERVVTRKIKKPRRSIMVITDTNLLDEALVAKLSINQTKN